MLILHFVGLDKTWVWQIPLRDDVWSVGVVTPRENLIAVGGDAAALLAEIVPRNRNLAHSLRRAHAVRDFQIETDYSYRIEQLSGPGWLLVGDALRFVDPVFATGIDIACYSAAFAHEAIVSSLRGGDEREAWDRFESRITAGVEVWTELIRLFYELQNLFTLSAVQRRSREDVVRVMQGNPYEPASLERARRLIQDLRAASAGAHASDGSLLLPTSEGTRLHVRPEHEDDDALAADIRRLLEEHYQGGVGPGAINDAVELIQAGVLDSFGVLQLINDLEDQLGIFLEPDDLVGQNFATIGAIVALARRRMSRAGRG